MSPNQPRRPRAILDLDSYQALCRQVLKRDGWKCQQCGTSTQLEIHHIRFRSALGGDTEENLITLCSGCHRNAHHGQPKSRN